MNMTKEEEKIFYAYLKYREELLKSHFIEGATGELSPAAIYDMADNLAAIFTINKFFKEDKQ